MNIEKAVHGFRLKAFNKFTFGVLKDCTVVRVGPKKVTVKYDNGRTESYLFNKPEWYCYPYGHPRAGQFFTFTR